MTQDKQHTPSDNKTSYLVQIDPKPVKRYTVKIFIQNKQNYVTENLSCSWLNNLINQIINGWEWVLRSSQRRWNASNESILIHTWSQDFHYSEVFHRSLKQTSDTNKHTNTTTMRDLKDNQNKTQKTRLCLPNIQRPLNSTVLQEEAPEPTQRYKL